MSKSRLQNEPSVNKKIEPEQNIKSEPTAQEKMLRGSAWMTAGSITSRILGALYIIPWVAMFGAESGQANALFAIGYNIYSLFLVISTAGIPGAVAKQVAHYNAMNEYSTGRKLFRSGIYLMVIMGIVSAALLYFVAPWLSTGNPDAIPVIRSLAWPLLIIPVMSLVRGFFQGYQDMAPSAISQFIEQVARIIYMLAMTFWIMRVLHGNYVSAVTQSTFAAFIGAIASLLVLGWYFLRKRSGWNELSRNSAAVLDISTRDMLTEMVRQAIPFIILDAGITIFQLVDQYTFIQWIGRFMSGTKADFYNYYQLFAFSSNKLIMITVSLASSMAVTSIPLLSEAFTKGDRKSLREQIDSMLELFFFIMIPAAIGMAAVAKPLYTIFYSYNFTGTLILEFSSYVAIILGLFTVLAAMMQGLYQNKKAILYFVIGLIVKLIVQYPMIALLKVFGPLMATAIGLGVTSFLMMRSLHQRFDLNFNEIVRRLAGILFSAILMYGVCVIIEKGLFTFLNPASRLQSMLVLIIVAGLGAVVYGYCMLRSRLADEILGERVAGLRRRLRIK
ncbi:putative polysaccharide biosynthesis protein [Loigolactobacillus backii]|uniref:Transporter n=1 Tax=Loigolactobacillus backii TaxID=375175 RepID=A0A192H1J8_9LACO|nr:polysaccharide biosynthesis protein [Loigolactobacillus backii]ANK62684.1 transporter [Loigolactobacillus backii]ANK64263.1 transporter [Loigolactobacillus backii]ANK67343.1 transporter [Loigolactobacillus backii]ANK70308.1 transporter [Loigolactobacillus backii]MDA5389529.1 polysaccharide biosynthesis protein [Loigolactobacillus backii]